MQLQKNQIEKKGRGKERVIFGNNFVMNSSNELFQLDNSYLIINKIVAKSKFNWIRYALTINKLKDSEA